VAWIPISSAVVALAVFLILHFFIEPRKENRKLAQERLNKLYGPMYSLIIARYNLAGRFLEEVTLGSIKDHRFLTKEHMDDFFLENSGYASTELIHVWGKYASNDMLELETIHDMIKTVVREYNELRKYLNMDYDIDAIQDGFPQMMRERLKK